MLRWEISVEQAAARSPSTCSEASSHSRGSESIAHSEPMMRPVWSRSGWPAYATTPRSGIARLSRSRSSSRASAVTTGAWSCTTHWQKEWVSGVWRASW